MSSARVLGHQIGQGNSNEKEGSKKRTENAESEFRDHTSEKQCHEMTVSSFDISATKTPSY